MRVISSTLTTVVGRGKEKARSRPMVSLMMAPSPLAMRTPSPVLVSSQRTIELCTMLESREPASQNREVS